MEEERREVLKMLSEGKVTVEEAERLLAALDAHASAKGAPKREHHRQQQHHREQQHREERREHREQRREHRRQERRSRKANFFHKAARFGFGIEPNDLRRLAEVLRREVSFAVGDTPPAWEVCEPVGLGSSFGSGAELTIWSSSDRLELVMADGDGSQIEHGDGRVREVDPDDAVEVVLRGRSRVQVGRSVERLRVISAGGPVESRGLTVATEVRSLGGDIRLLGHGAPFQASSAGGHIDVELTEDARGRGSADTLGGDIELTLGPDLGGTLSTWTLGGAVLGDELGGEEPGAMGRSEANLDGKRGPVELYARTLGGDIRVRRATVASGRAA